MKKHRPFPAGHISIMLGLVSFPCLLLLAFLGAWLLLPIEFVGVLLVYYALTFSYSLWLMRFIAVDLIDLASLYIIITFKPPRLFWRPVV
ncbi:hypothetical protein [Vreelandella neptunia]|uniref:hypothetical protein n=1 Tax=Vreelandella neptunia TaxID=115551 RepID=UPI003CC9BD9B